MRRSSIIIILLGLSMIANCTLTASSNAGPMWIQNIKHEGLAAFNNNPASYPVYRNVRDYGAKGDGTTDDTASINAAITAGSRCGQYCDSSTIVPALVFFPSGTYLVSGPIIQYYYTQLVGDATNLPTLLATPNFSGIAVIDSNPYAAGGYNWFANQNNFYRQVRNFKIDLTLVNGGATGVHWQVAQATSLTNIIFQMSDAKGGQHQGIFMENGSGGFMSDLIFNGGKLGMFLGNQQFTARNITINNAETAAVMIWSWGWTFKTLNINNCDVGLDISAGGSVSQSVGSAIVLDAVFTNTPIGVKTSTTATSQPHTAGTLVLDNVKLTNVPVAVQGPSGNTLLQGTGAGQTTVIDSWGQGQIYNDKSGRGTFVQGKLNKPVKSASLLNAQTGQFFERTRPQYEEFDATQFISVKSLGARGDGKTDDTAAVQNAINQAVNSKIVYFPAGTYLIFGTVNIPAGSRLVGELWSTISATGAFFQQESAPQPMFKVGNAGDSGVAEITDLVFSTQGPVPGAVLVEWNIRDPVDQQGVAGMWDTHFRIGGAAGTNLGSNECNKNSPGFKESCKAAYLALHLTPSSSCYLENVWAWISDHDLDNNHDQISIYNARGILIESAQGPVWMYGTASEHSVLYQYQILNAQNVLMAMIQTESPYFQSSPRAPYPFQVNTAINDPDFADCDANKNSCFVAWGLRVVSSKNIYIYGAGLYNFFQNYDQTCLDTEDCQDSIVSIEGNTSSLYIYNLNTKASKSMAKVDGQQVVQQSDNRNGFCSSIVGLFAKSNSNDVIEQAEEDVKAFLKIRI